MKLNEVKLDGITINGKVQFVANAAEALQAVLDSGSDYGRYLIEADIDGGVLNVDCSDNDPLEHRVWVDIGTVAPESFNLPAGGTYFFKAATGEAAE